MLTKILVYGRRINRDNENKKEKCPQMGTDVRKRTMEGDYF